MKDLTMTKSLFNATRLGVPVLLLLSACEVIGGARRTEKDGLMAPAALPQALLVPPESTPPPTPLLGPGDLLTISVFREPDLHLEARISQDGRITFPLIGPMQAAGRTLPELEQAIGQRLEKDYLKDPVVTVMLKDYAKRRVYLVGGVTKPGSYEFSPAGRLTLLQAVAGAEGLSDRARKEFVQILRRKGSEGRTVILLSMADMEKRIAQGQADADLELWPDDLVVIPTAVRAVYVLGAVHRPGNMELPANCRMTVSMAVSYAGSYTKFASTGRVQLLRTTPAGEIRKMSVDLDAVLSDGQLELDLPLEPGDVIWVPERGIF